MKKVVGNVKVMGNDGYVISFLLVGRAFEVTKVREQM